MKSKTFLFLIICYIVFLFSCGKLFDPKSEKINNPPNTTITNVPVENDTLYALATLQWDGEDEDGYIVSYQYRYTTYPLGNSFGDSIVHDWQETEENKLTIPFTSPDNLNRQYFRIRAIDNSGNIDPTPATKTVFTYRTTPPTTKILSPRTGTEYFATFQTNYWFPGVVVTISGEDKDGFIIEYAWSADDGDWHWVNSKDSVVTIKPEDFKQPITGEHTIKVRSKDDTYLVDPVGASITVDLVEPTFERDILILDDTREDVSLGHVADNVHDDFYFEIFGHSNNYTIEERNMKTRAFPALKILGRYKLIIWHSDDNKTPFYIKNTKAMEGLLNYLHVGGDLILCGSRILEPWFPTPDPIMGLPHPFYFESGSFVYDYLHIRVGELSDNLGTFTGANGVGEFSDVEIDTSKITSDFPYFGKPHLVQVVVEKGPFTREILTFQGNDTYAENWPCAIRYYGDVYDIAYIGFPLWALKLDDAKNFAAQLLRSMGY
jgi:hypothetical protein